MPKSKDNRIFEEVGSLIKKKREEIGFSQKELAKSIDMGYTSIERYESGYSKIAIDYLLKIAKILGVDISYFFPENKSKISAIPALSLSDEIAFDSSKYQTVPVYTLAETGKFADLTKIKPIDTLIIPEEFNFSSITVVKIPDNTMEPVIMKGAYVGIDKNNKEATPGDIYCVYLSKYGESVIRYVIIENREGITLKSKKTEFGNINIPKEDIDNKENPIIGRVKWVWQDI
ncbi:MAG: XRE family transcriptional regulator [bacterium]